MDRDDQRVTTRGEVDLHGESPGPPLRQQAVVGAAVVALVVVLLAGFGVVGVVRDEPYSVFTREVIEQTGAKTYTGFLAHVTWFLWVVAGTAGLLAAAALRRRDPRDRRIPFFLGTSALTGLLLVDDFAMLHERVLPKVGIPQEAQYGLYAVILLALLLWFRPQFKGGGALLAVAAGAFWAVSIASDIPNERWGIPGCAAEDGAKMIGTALWAAFMVWSCLRSVGVEPQDVSQSPSTTRDPDARR